MEPEDEDGIECEVDHVTRRRTEEGGHRVAQTAEDALGDETQRDGRSAQRTEPHIGGCGRGERRARARAECADDELSEKGEDHHLAEAKEKSEPKCSQDTRSERTTRLASYERGGRLDQRVVEELGARVPGIYENTRYI